MYKDIHINYNDEFDRYTSATLVENDYNAYRIFLHTPWDLSGCSARVTCRRADGLVIADLADVSGNDIVYIVNNAMYASEGELSMRISVISSDGSVLTACNAIFTAVPAYIGATTAESGGMVLLDKIQVQLLNLQTNVAAIQSDLTGIHTAIDNAKTEFAKASAEAAKVKENVDILVNWKPYVDRELKWTNYNVDRVTKRIGIWTATPVIEKLTSKFKIQIDFPIVWDKWGMSIDVDSDDLDDYKPPQSLGTNISPSDGIVSAPMLFYNKCTVTLYNKGEVVTTLTTQHIGDIGGVMCGILQLPCVEPIDSGNTAPSDPDEPITNPKIDDVELD